MTAYEDIQKRVLAQRALDDAQGDSGSQTSDATHGSPKRQEGASSTDYGPVLDGLRAMPRVVVESPYAGDIAKNVEYARAAVRDCLMRGEAPIASHLLHTQEGILEDDQPRERAMGMAAGWAWIETANLVAVYRDLGISNGMQDAIEIASRFQIPIEFRSLEE